MLKICQTCGEKCHINHDKCPNCKTQLKKRPISPSKLTRKHTGTIWDEMVLKICCICWQVVLKDDSKLNNKIIYFKVTALKSHKHTSAFIALQEELSRPTKNSTKT